MALVAASGRRVDAEQHDGPMTSPTARTEREGGSRLVLRVLSEIGARLPRLHPTADLAAALATRVTRHRGSILAAGFAYFALLALVPTAIALGSIAAWIGDGAALRDALERAIERVPTLEGATGDLLGSLIDVVDRTSGTAFGLTSIIGGLIALYAASKAFVTSSQIIDLAYERPLRERSWLVQLVAAVAVLVVLVGTTVWVLLIQGLPRLQRAFGITPTFDGPWASLLFVAIAVVAVLLMFGAAYRFGAPPGRNPPLISAGAALAAVVVLLGTVFTAVYVQLSAQFSAAVAVLGGVLVLLFWLYVVGTALVLGAELEAVLGGEADRGHDSGFAQGR
jgi:membrane protein